MLIKSRLDSRDERQTVHEKNCVRFSLDFTASVSTFQGVLFLVLLFMTLMEGLQAKETGGGKQLNDRLLLRVTVLLSLDF